MGATDRLLNADHDEIYFNGMPMYKGMVCVYLLMFEYLHNHLFVCLIIISFITFFNLQAGRYSFENISYFFPIKAARIVSLND